MIFIFLFFHAAGLLYYSYLILVIYFKHSRLDETSYKTDQNPQLLLMYI